MSMTFTKLFTSITESTVWLYSDQARLVWITMLAMADRRGRVFASVPGLAHRARVDLEECRSALALFLAPDSESRTKDFDGRRIEEIDGGWVLLNHAKYRAMMDEENIRESKRVWAEKNRESKKNSTVEEVDSDRDKQRQIAEADSEAKEETPPLTPQRGDVGGGSAPKEKPKRPRFEKPSMEEVRAFITEQGYEVDYEEWYGYYVSNGWKVGKNPMQNWRAAVLTWEKKRRTGG